MAKTKYVAVHTVHLLEEPGKARTRDNPGKPAKVKVLTPGTAMMLTKDEAADLLASGAIKEAPKATEEEVVETSASSDGEPAEKSSGKARGKGKGKGDPDAGAPELV